ncbi:MAG: NAD(+)/NADH kinase [Deltaproteobacteria bacterium]|nr:NAD(+)/NADH kinase [Deltaproteobacteria bacterium]
MRIDKALVVYNKPLYQLHVLEQKDPHYIGLLKKKHPTTRLWRAVHAMHHETLEGVQRTLELLGIATDTVFRGQLKKIGNYDLVVTVGGDGTFLDISHILGNQVLLGVNSAPIDSTGALCRARVGDFLTVLVELIAGKRKPQWIPRLKVKVNGKAVAPPVLNEVLFANQSSAGTARYRVLVGKTAEEQKSSGIWIAAPTGSTAAIRSAGGKPMPLTKPAMQYVVRELFPEPGKRFRIRKGILPKGKKLTIYSRMRQGALFIDGNKISVPLNFGDKVEISADGKPLRAVL